MREIEPWGRRVEQKLLGRGGRRLWSFGDICIDASKYEPDL